MKRSHKRSGAARIIYAAQIVAMIGLSIAFLVIAVRAIHSPAEQPVDGRTYLAYVQQIG